MPNNPRQAVKRKLDQASAAIDTCLGHLMDASATYRPGVHEHKPDGYPEYYQPIDMTMESLLLTQSVINDLKRQI